MPPPPNKTARDPVTPPPPTHSPTHPPNPLLLSLQDPVEFVEGLLAMREKYEAAIAQAFADDKLFRNSLNQVWRGGGRGVAGAVARGWWRRARPAPGGSHPCMLGL